MAFSVENSEAKKDGAFYPVRRVRQVADVAAAKALELEDEEYLIIRGKGTYRYDVSSTLVADDTLWVIEPDDGIGRLIHVERDTHLEEGRITAGMFGARMDGAADDAAAIQAAVATGETYLFGTSVLGSELLFTSGRVQIKGVRGRSILKKTTSANIIRCVPEPVSQGTASSTGSLTTITVAGANWAVNEHAGNVVTIPAALLGGTQARWIVSNTADTLTLEEELDTAATANDEVFIITPLESVEIDGLELDGQSNGSAGLVIQYARRVVLRDLYVHDHGGNGITIHGCKNVRVYSPRVENSQFGIFVYNSDDVRLVTPTSKNNTSTYNIQLKDCRDSEIIAPTVEGGFNGVNIKTSGLNPSRNVSCIGGTAYNCSAAGFYSHSLANEGTRFVGHNYSFIGPKTYGCGTGIDIDEDPANQGRLEGLRVISPQVYDSAGVGMVLEAPGIVVTDPVVERSGNNGIRITASRIRVVRPRLVDNNYGAVGGVELRIDSGERSVVDSPIIRHSDANSGSLIGVRELAGADYTLIRNPQIIDDLDELTTDCAVDGAGSRIIGDIALSKIGGASAINTEYLAPASRTRVVAVTGTTGLETQEIEGGARKYDGELVVLQPTGNFIVQVRNLALRRVGFTVRLFNASPTHTLTIVLISSGQFANGADRLNLGPLEYAEIERLDEDTVGGNVIVAWRSQPLTRNWLVGKSTDNGTDRLQVVGTARVDLPSSYFRVAEADGSQGGLIDADTLLLHLFGGDSNGGKDVGIWFRNEETAADWVVAMLAAANKMVWLRDGAQRAELDANGNYTAAGTIQGAAFHVAGKKVVGAQQAAIADDASGASNEATMNAVLAALRAHGLIAT